MLRPVTDQEWEEIQQDCKVALMRYGNEGDKGTLDTIKDYVGGATEGISAWGQKTFSTAPDGAATRQSQTTSGMGYAMTGTRMPGTLDSVAGSAQQYLGMGGDIADNLTSLDPTGITSTVTMTMNAGKGIAANISHGNLQHLAETKGENWCSPALGTMMPQLMEWKQKKARRSGQAAASGALALGGLAFGGTDLGITSGVGVLGLGALYTEKAYKWVKHGVEDDETPEDKRKRFAFEIVREARSKDPRIRAEATIIIQALGLSKDKLLDKDGEPLPGAEALLLAEMASW
ncbi:MAG: hypothetical protein H0W28_12685 [Pyrinomonadaceae bacterium]|nr:hypothetical protein [Pyrinomonadaceae bacterium]